MSDPNPQTQSALLTRLPREVLDHIYAQLWRSYGAAQHIVWHGYGRDGHLCHWPCSTVFRVDEDPVQRDIEELCKELGVELGKDIRRDRDLRAVIFGRRLQSPWLNHWACGERAEAEYGLQAVRGSTTWAPKCWRTERTGAGQRAGWNPYIPMLLTCKMMSSQCLESIYASTTFVFTDMMTIQMFFGLCTMHPKMSSWPEPAGPPPAFFKYVRHVEISLTPDFPKLLFCANFDVPDGPQRRHDANDFHWLRLDRFQNLQRVDIWVPARSLTIRESDNDFVGIKQLDVDALRKSLAVFEQVRSLRLKLSTPLGPSVGPKGDGAVEGLTSPRLQVYKRGTGDKFHPFLNMINPGGTLDGLIHTAHARQVRLGRNGGEFDLMKEV